MSNENYDDVIVKKPWGFEYLCFANNTVAIWLLNIDFNESTSMHCHPNKNTGLIVLNGTIELSFLTNKIELTGLKKINIFQSRFHSSKAISSEGAFLLEVETPEDKNDLVRLYDNYGRENKGYEGKSNFIEKPNSALNFGEAKHNPEIINAYGCNIQHKLLHNVYDFDDLNQNDLVVFTNGGLTAGERKKIVRPADVIDGNSLKLLASKFNLERKTSSLIIKREN